MWIPSIGCGTVREEEDFDFVRRHSCCEWNFSRLFVQCCNAIHYHLISDLCAFRHPHHTGTVKQQWDLSLCILHLTGRFLWIEEKRFWKWSGMQLRPVIKSLLRQFLVKFRFLKVTICQHFWLFKVNICQNFWFLGKICQNFDF